MSLRLDVETTPATRRLFLRGIAGAVAIAVSPSRLLAGPREERILSFVHTHTHQHLSVPYFADGAYLPEALASLSTFLRDHRTGDEHAIDPALYDILNDLRLATGTKRPFQVISAYRSPRTNAMLRENGGGVAKGSLHLQGRAIDVRLADVASASLRDAAIELRRGGVGYYAVRTSSTWTPAGFDAGRPGPAAGPGTAGCYRDPDCPLEAGRMASRP